MTGRSTSAAYHRTGHTGHTGLISHSGKSGKTGHSHASPSPPTVARAHSASPPSSTRPAHRARRHSTSHTAIVHEHSHLHPAHALHPSEHGSQVHVGHVRDERAAGTTRHRSHSHSHSCHTQHQPAPSLHPSSSNSRSPSSTLTRAPRSPRLPRTDHAPDFTSSSTVHHGMTLEVPGADPAAHASWGHEPPITPTIPDCQMIAPSGSQQYVACHCESGCQVHAPPRAPTMLLPTDHTPMPAPMQMQMPMPMALPVPSSVAIAHMSRPHPHSIASPLTHTPLSMLGSAAVTPQAHGYGQPKYMKVVKPDYRRFCYSAGKADVPIVPMFQHYYSSGMGRGWDQEMSPGFVRRYGEWVV